jgi:uncharacterized protein
MNELSQNFNYADGDVDTNQSANGTLQDLIDQRYSRRQTLVGGVSAAAMAVFGTSMLTGCDPEDLVILAGENGTSASGRMVTLSVSTDEDTSGLQKASWTQISGPKVKLEGANTAVAKFLAPVVDTATELKFRFTAKGAIPGSPTSKSGTFKAESTVVVNPPAIGFNAVPKNKNDIVTVPEGYTVSVLYRTGDPISPAAPAFANDGTDTNYALRAGDHHDALYYFGLAKSGNRPDPDNNERGLLVMNHENINQAYLHPAGPTTVAGKRPEAEAIKEIECHGVSVIEVLRNSNGEWIYKLDSKFNRRLTPLTPVEFTGPARGHAQMKTAYSPSGTEGRGTINNCANGFTYYGTSMTCEENWAFYFKRVSTDSATRTSIGGTTAKTVASLARYGVTSTSGNYGWSTVTPADPSDTSYARWNASADAAQAADGSGDFRFEPNQFGWVIEMDPYDPKAKPRKRTTMGRFAHEGAWPSLFVAGVKPAVYLGDDSRNEYLYKFVSATPWDWADAKRKDRLAVGDKYWDDGTLYVAKFNADGTGTWIPLVFGQNGIDGSYAPYPFADQADVLINTRLAGDAVGATKMDRPEWTATNEVTGEVYLTLTNNSATLRPLNGTNAANPRHYNDPKGATNQYGNPNGHILRLRETGDTTEATTFAWDIYLFGAGADLPADANVSGLDDTNDFSSPDGLWFGRAQNASGVVAPTLWIQTDDGAYTDVTNCMMLVGQPGHVGDGGPRTIHNVGSGGATADQNTFVGANPGTKLRRFMVGPKECELTGVDSTPDGRTLFVNIQHPGELGNPSNITSNWPQSQGGVTSGRPRSATVVITKNDGGIVGL